MIVSYFKKSFISPNKWLILYYLIILSGMKFFKVY
jgi:hypothetical protein